MDSDRYPFVDRVADALVEFLDVPPSTAVDFAERLCKSLGLSVENQWVPFTDSEQLNPVRQFKRATEIIRSDPTVVRVDREYRFVSRWFNPSRGD